MIGRKGVWISEKKRQKIQHLRNRKMRAMTKLKPLGKAWWKKGIRTYGEEDRAMEMEERQGQGGGQ